ncbi:MAG: hypothetical protein LWW92_00355 [Rhodocyclales bacterium]|nr:hypothetical protein [Rhodocyclales bacterium]
MKKLFLVAVAGLTLGAISAHAGQENNIQIRAGKLRIVETPTGDQVLLLNNKKLSSFTSFSVTFEQKYAIGDRDVILLANNSGGMACPMQYLFVSASVQGDVRVTPEFGTCSDLIKPVQQGGKITVTMPKMNGRGSTSFAYENGALYENGKLAKGSQPPLEEGDVMINGFGQVLTSGNPSKKWVDCVRKRAPQADQNLNNWEEQVVAECKRLSMR